VTVPYSHDDPAIFLTKVTHLVVDLWYLCWSDDQQPNNSAENSIRKAKNGYWKHVESCKVPTSIGIMGMKIILQFYEGHAPCGKRTGWVMHEYQVEQNDEANLPQVSCGFS
jgi:hypothetical protein